MAITVLFFNSATLVAREMANALRARKDIRFINVTLPFSPPAADTDRIFGSIGSYMPALALSINDAGYDAEGRLQKRLIDAGSYIVNWYHDYPFFFHEFHNRAYTPSPRRIDCCSEKSYVPLLDSRGFKGYFLPLATDPAYFNIRGDVAFERDIAFVGNSSLELMEQIIDESMSAAIESCRAIYNRCKRRYNQDFTFNIREYLMDIRKEWEPFVAIPAQNFVFGMEWLIGFQYRRDFLREISNTWKDRFTVFGDLYWKRYITESNVTPEACYYDNLCRYYRSTKINLNVNRVQIRTSFTQRHFDCKASGAFLLTDRRECNRDYFITNGTGQEIVEYDSCANCKALIAYYLLHEQERLRIAENGVQRILLNHTYANRIEEILALCKKTWGV